MRTQIPVLKDLVVIPENVFIVSGKLADIELEATDVEIIAVSTGGIVGNRYLIKMGRHDRIQRIEGDAGGREKINRVSYTAGRIPVYAQPGLWSQDGAVSRTRITLDKLFVREEEERSVFPARNGPATFAKAREVHWSANIKTIVMLTQDRLGRFYGLVEPGIGVGSIINNLKECSTVVVVGTTLGDEVDLCDAAA